MMGVPVSQPSNTQQQQLPPQNVKVPPPLPNLNAVSQSPQTISKDSYANKYDRSKEKLKTWRYKICIGLTMLIMTILTMIEGIVGIIFAAVAIGDEKSETEDAELQMARSIQDTVLAYDRLQLIDIQVSTVGTCPEGWKAIFGREWEGIRKGCWFEDELMTMEDYEGTKQARKQDRKCDDDDFVDEVDSVWQYVFNGNTVCGKYGGQNIADTPTPTAHDECPEGYSICNPKTEGQKLDAQYCLKNELYPQECPIIDMKFWPTSKLAELSDTDWIKLSYRGSSSGEEPLSLVYTKTASTQAPISHTYVGVAPCLNPDQLIMNQDSLPEKYYRYPLERTPDTCKSQVDERPDEDDRYTALSTVNNEPKYSELDVQIDSGVLQILEKQLRFEDLVPEARESKAKIFYEFYSRPAATWTCSREKMKEAVKVAKEYDEKSSQASDGSWMMVTAFIFASCNVGLILGPLITICCIVVKCRQHCCFKVMMYVALGLEIVLCIPASIFATLAQDTYKDREAYFKQLNSVVAGCSDEYTYITDEIIEEQLERPVKYGEIAMILLNLFAGLIYLKYLIILVLVICIRYQSKKK